MQNPDPLGDVTAERRFTLRILHLAEESFLSKFFRSAAPPVITKYATTWSRKSSDAIVLEEY